MFHNIKHHFLLLILPVVLIMPLFSQQTEAAEQPLIQMGMIADAQYCNCEPKVIPMTGIDRFYLSTPAKMEQAARTFNRKPLDFAIELGDSIDRDYASFDTMVPLYNKINAPLYHVLGNHDFPNRDYSAMTALGMKLPYYSFVKKNIRFVVLDTNQISTYANPAGSEYYKIAVSRINKLRAAGMPQGQHFNGAVTKRQLRYLDRTLKKAQDAGQKVIMISHHPVYPLRNDNVFNAQDILDVIDKYNNVVAYFNGHTHDGKYNIRNGVHFVNLKGMVETSGDNAYSVVKIYHDRLRIVGFGREESRTLMFKSIN